MFVGIYQLGTATTVLTAFSCLQMVSAPYLQKIRGRPVRAGTWQFCVARQSALMLSTALSPLLGYPSPCANTICKYGVLLAVFNCKLTSVLSIMP